jgi:methionine-rich copper-binding protein CopC
MRPTRSLATALLVLALTATAASALVHTHLVKAEPGIDAKVKDSPTQVRLWFSERPDVALTSASLFTADTTLITEIKLATTDDTLSVGGPVASTLAPGKYIVRWRVAAEDGHVMRGRYAFYVDPTAPAQP